MIKASETYKPTDIQTNIRANIGINTDCVRHVDSKNAYKKNQNIIIKVVHIYLTKFWKVVFSKLRFIEIFFSEERASAEIVRDESMHYAEKYIGLRHGSFWFCMSAPIKKKTSHIFTQPGYETCRLKVKFDAPNVHSSLQLQFIFKESKFKIKYYSASALSPHSV